MTTAIANTGGTTATENGYILMAYGTHRARVGTKFEFEINDELAGGVNAAQGSAVGMGDFAWA